MKHMLQNTQGGQKVLKHQKGTKARDKAKAKIKLENM